ncbi:MAG: HEAT repeat domain-containing protein [Labilithrix sp.]|nr:HEAT repeat domain-containing protein [Labilithrix sp.]
MSRRGVRVALFAVATSFAVAADAQPGRPPTRPRPTSQVTATPPSGPTNLRARVGIDHAARLIRSADPDERIRGIQRAASTGTPEAIALLVESLERSPQLKADTRALVAMARGLAPFADRERARTGLLGIVGTGNPGLVGRLPTARSDGALEEGDPIARAELAREIAAIALARAGGDRAHEALYGAARGGGSGQSAALLALAMYPPRDPGFFGTAGAATPAAVVQLLGRLGDLRALDVLHAAARSNDVNVRSAALVSLAELGDARASLLARTAIAESDVRLRAASGEVFILLAAPERFKATAAIVADDATTKIGLRMAERVFSPEITKLVAARAWEHPDRELRAAAVRALGRSPDPEAASALVAPQLLGDPELAYYAVHALARSPAPNAGALIGGLLPTRLSALAARAYVVRALMRGERTSTSDDAIFRLSRSRSEAERALGVFARVALDDASAADFIDDKAPRVRRAAVMASTARPPSASLTRALLARLAKDDDPITRQVLAVALAGGDPDGTVKTSLLVERAESAGGDAPLAAFALARRADETTSRKIGQLLGSKDPVLRAHAARGLAFASLPDAAGRLAELYAYETDIEVRRAAVAALAARTGDATAPARKETLAAAADLDPDGPVRQTARRALAGATRAFAEPAVHEVAWLRLTRDDGGPPAEAFVGSIVRADGLAVPVVFDEEGFAVVPGLPPGEARVVLSPRLPAYTEAKRP